jgi:APA family basic amino acid/polyamine antiporter
MTSIGTLFAFILVCAGVLVMRKTQPDAPRAFRTPLVPLIPVLGILVCLGMMVFLPFDTWIRLVCWMMIGLDVYLYRGIKNSFLGKANNTTDDPKNYTVTAISGIFMTVLLAVLAYLHHQNAEVDDSGLIMFSVAMIIIHAILYGYYFIKYRK